MWEISAGRSPVLVSTHGDFELFQSVVRGRLTRKKLGEAVEMYRDIINEIEFDILSVPVLQGNHIYIGILPITHGSLALQTM